MKKPEYHLFVCNSFRISGEPKGACNKRGSGLIQYLEEEILDRGIDALVTSTGCFKECDKGPVLVVHPKNDWYGNINEAVLDEILDALEEGSKAENHLISQ